jgi:hypothetical protein
MKENIDQSRMLPIQSGNRMSQGLDGVRKAARERQQERFTSVLHHVTTSLLRDSFYALKRQASPESMVSGGRSMNPGWRVGSLIFTAGFTAERSERNLQGESTKHLRQMEV